MPRPPKCRTICQYPDFWSFSPDEGDNGAVELTLDEFEVIRLIDKEGCTQEEAAEQISVARTTVTSIYDSARRKIADSLVNGKRLVIGGGQYRLKELGLSKDIVEKGTDIMRIAVTFENGQVFQHFGHTEQFKLFDAENGTVVKEQVVGTDGQGHGALAGFLKQASVDTLICGGIGGGALRALSEAGIEIYAGIDGSADEAVKALLAGSLVKNDSANCDHHHGEDHECGDHGCGNHSCH